MVCYSDGGLNTVQFCLLFRYHLNFRTIIWYLNSRQVKYIFSDVSTFQIPTVVSIQKRLSTRLIIEKFIFGNLISKLLFYYGVICILHNNCCWGSDAYFYWKQSPFLQSISIGLICWDSRSIFKFKVTQVFRSKKLRSIVVWCSIKCIK